MLKRVKVTFRGTIFLLVPPPIHPMGQTVITKNIFAIFKPTIKPNMFGYKRTSQSLISMYKSNNFIGTYNFWKARQGPIHKTITRTG